MSKDKDNSRRKFFKATSNIAVLSLASSSILSAVDHGSNHASLHHHNNNKKPSKISITNRYKAKKFFVNEGDFLILSHACERIFPEDNLGPGAIKLGAPYFIDNALAGTWGNNVREYRSGPFYEGIPEQNYQTHLNRASIFLLGVKQINHEAIDKFSLDFIELKDEDKDLILSNFQKGLVAMKGVTSSHFFNLLRFMVLAGVYADPMYNGNDDMEGWRMKEYPGAQMSYVEVIGSEEFDLIAPISMSDM